MSEQEREQPDPDELDQHDPGGGAAAEEDIEQDPAYNPPEGPLKDMKGG